MGRSLHHLIKVVNDLIAKGVDIISIQDPLNTTSAQGRLMFYMFASLAEFEKDLIIEDEFGEPLEQLKSLFLDCYDFNLEKFKEKR